jgi:hypothetical protein
MSTNLPLTTIIIIIVAAFIPLLVILFLRWYNKPKPLDVEQVKVEIPQRMHKTGEYDYLFRAYRDLSKIETSQ